MTLARYTPEEARALEDHYIACAQRIGVWGRGVAPSTPMDKGRAKQAGTAAGEARQRRSFERKMSALEAVRNGVTTSEEISAMLGVTPNCARRYLRELFLAKLIEPTEEVLNGVVVTWRAVDTSKRAA